MYWCRIRAENFVSNLSEWLSDILNIMGMFYTNAWISMRSSRPFYLAGSTNNAKFHKTQFLAHHMQMVNWKFVVWTEIWAHHNFQANETIKLHWNIFCKKSTNGVVNYILMNYHRKYKGELTLSTHGVCTNRFTQTWNAMKLWTFVFNPNPSSCLIWIFVYNHVLTWQSNIWTRRS